MMRMNSEGLWEAQQEDGTWSTGHVWRAGDGNEFRPPQIYLDVDQVAPPEPLEIFPAWFRQAAQSVTDTLVFMTSLWIYSFLFGDPSFSTTDVVFGFVIAQIFRVQRLWRWIKA